MNLSATPSTVAPRQDAPLARCPLCDAADTREFWRAERLPVFCNVLLPSLEASRAAPVAELRLAFCNKCSAIFNAAFDPRLVEYDPRYENSLHFSPRFQQYAVQLADELIERYGLRNKQLVEIGCGDARFLQLLCERGGNHGLGFDPSHDSAQSDPSRQSRVRIVAELFTRESAGAEMDFVLCRHVLEHISRPQAFLRQVRQAIGDRSNAAVFFEVPNALFTIEDQGVWDIIYEHCHYFTRPALVRLFQRSGFRVNDARPRYGGQFLSVEAQPDEVAGSHGCHGDEVERVGALVDDFRRLYNEKVAWWREEFMRWKNSNAKVVLWGAGSKGVTLLNVVKAELADLPYIVDLNPRKQGRFVPGTGQEVIAPEELRRYQPKLVIVMNPLYREEVVSLLDELNVQAEVVIA